MRELRTEDHEMRGTLQAMVAGLLFGTAGILIKTVEGVGAFQIAFARLAIAAAFLLLWLIVARRGHRITPMRKDALIFALAGLLAGIHFSTFVFALKFTYVINATTLVNMSPLIVLILSPALLREKIRPLSVFGVFCATVGALAMVRADQFAFDPARILGDFYALVSALAYATYVVVSRKVRSRYEFFTFMLWVYTIGAAMIAAISLPMGSSSIDLSQRNFLILLLLGILPTLLGHSLLNISLRYISAVRASTIVLLEPASGSLYALFLLGESPNPLTLAGFVLIILGLVAVNAPTVSAQMFIRSSSE